MEEALLPASPLRHSLLNVAGFIEEKEWKGPFTFIQGADTQFGMIDSYIYKKKDPKWDKEIILTTEAIRKINCLNPKPRFFVICGDMLDAFPYRENGLIERRDKQYLDFVNVFRTQLDPEIKLVCVCGNHDVGDQPSLEAIQKYRREFGADYFTFWVGGVKFVVLNSQYFKDGTLVPAEVKAHDDFLNTIADPAAKHIVVFQHIPFFLKSSSEDSDYFTIEKKTRIELLERLYDSGVRYIFCGHYHRNAGGFYKEMNQVVTSAVGCQLGVDKSGFRIVNVNECEISDTYVELPIQFLAHNE